MSAFKFNPGVFSAFLIVETVVIAKFLAKMTFTSLIAAAYLIANLLFVLFAAFASPNMIAIVELFLYFLLAKQNVAFFNAFQLALMSACHNSLAFLLAFQQIQYFLASIIAHMIYFIFKMRTN